MPTCDIHGSKRDMVNPAFRWSHERGCLRFACNMYRLSSHVEAGKISKLELRHSSRIDALIGELKGSFIERSDDVTYGRKLELSAGNYYDYKAHFGRSGAMESLQYIIAQAVLIE